jgi:glycerophosphoryl diester phosphodiesterase
MNDFTFIAHRGVSSKAPENTLAAFDLAVNKGFLNIELDVQLSRDGVPVIIHDSRIDRTTNGSGSVNSLSLEELKKLDAGSWFDSSFTSERIPMLIEVLERYSSKVHLHLELKSEEVELPEKVAKLLKEYGWLDYKGGGPFSVPGLTVTSPSLSQLKRSKELLPEIDHHWLSWDLNDEIIANALRFGLQGLCVTPDAANVELVAKAQSSGLIIRGLGVESEKDIDVFIQANIQAATTNWPDQIYSSLSSSWIS